MEDEIVKKLEEKLKVLILTMESPCRKRLGRYCNWGLISKSLLEGVFKLNDWDILQKKRKQFCFTIIHEEKCEGPCLCSCKKTVPNPRIQVYYLSDLFTKMISVSHFQMYFSGEFYPKVLSEIIDGLKVSSNHIKLFCDDDARLDQENGDADYEEIEKEKYCLNFKRNRDEFNSLISKYLMLAFTDPTSLPQFLLDVDKGPTMPLSELIAWAE
jgi:hypothetical protein